MPDPFFNPPLAVRLTPPGIGAIAVILVVGSDAPLRQIAHAKRPPLDLPIGRFVRVDLVDSDQIPIDDALLVHTGPSRWELHVHGGTAVVEAVLQALQHAGAQLATLQQAQQAGLLDTELSGELLEALPSAITDTGLQVLLRQQHALANWGDRWLNYLRDDEARSPLWKLHAAAQWLLHRAQTLSRLLAGHAARVAIVGPPNAGKSTLANALLGRPVSITSEHAGTTRDWVDAHAVFSAGHGATALHVPVVLVDTAGVRTTPDELEQESIRRTHHQAATADVIIMLLDGSYPLTSQETQLLAAYPQALVAVNKMDVPGAAIPAPAAQRAALGISARNHVALDTLMERVLGALDLAHVTAEEPFAFSARLRALVAELALCNDRIQCTGLLNTIRLR